MERKSQLTMLPDALSPMDHPSGDGLNTWVISKVTKNAGIDMALSGLGGDELFAGYDLFKRLWYLNKFRFLGALPEGLKKVSSGILDISTPSVVIFKTKELLQLESWTLEHTFPLMRRLLSEKSIAALFSEPYSSPDRVADFVKGLALKELPFLSQISIAELALYMQNVLLRDTDQMSIEDALEVRVPFLDFELCEYVLRVDDKFKFPSSPKQLLVESLGTLLPREISHRKKMGFVFPWNSWMRNELKSYCESKSLQS